MPASQHAPTTSAPLALREGEQATFAALPLSIREGEQATLTAPKHGSLSIHANNDQGAIKIHWSEGRATVELQSASVQVCAPEDVSFHCERFHVQADQSIHLQSQGSFRANAEQDLELRAASLSLRATLGDLALRANDYVRAIGEKILLNTDTCPEQSQREIQSYLKRLLGYPAAKATGSDLSRREPSSKEQR